MIAQLLHGQKLVNSPYSRLGPGTLEPMAHLRVSEWEVQVLPYNDPLNFFYQNPASFSSVDTNSFVFDFALITGLLGSMTGRKL